MKAKLISLVLSLAMCLSCAGITQGASAEEIKEEEVPTPGVAIVYVVNDSKLKNKGLEIFKAGLEICKVTNPYTNLTIITEKDGTVDKFKDLVSSSDIEKIIKNIETNKPSSTGSKLDYSLNLALGSVRTLPDPKKSILIISDEEVLDSLKDELKVEVEEKEAKGGSRPIIPARPRPVRPVRPRPVRPVRPIEVKPRPVRPRPILPIEKINTEAVKNTVKQAAKEGVKVFVCKVEATNPKVEEELKNFKEYLDIAYIPEKPIVPETPENMIERLSGNSRIETAVEVSKAMYPSSAETVFLANKDKFPDVLAASPLAIQKKAPILFVNKGNIPKASLAEINRLNPKKIYIIGGENSVSENVNGSLKGKEIFRVAGKNRYATSTAIAELVRQGGSKDIIEVANGQNFPDALSISPLAIKENAPILLVDKNNAGKETKQYIVKYSKEIKTANIAGMYGSVSKEVEKDISNNGSIKVNRFGGKNRFETSAEIARKVGSEGMGVYTSGEIFADALVAGGYAGLNKAPLLLVKKGSAPKVIKDVSRELKIKQARIIGGESVINDDCRKEISLNLVK